MFNLPNNYKKWKIQFVHKTADTIKYEVFNSQFHKENHHSNKRINTKRKSKNE